MMITCRRMAALVRTCCDGTVAATPLGPNDVSSDGAAGLPDCVLGLPWPPRQGELGDLGTPHAGAGAPLPVGGPNDCSMSELMSDRKLVRESCTDERFFRRVFMAGLSLPIG